MTAMNKSVCHSSAISCGILFYKHSCFKPNNKNGVIPERKFCHHKGFWNKTSPLPRQRQIKINQDLKMPT